MGDRSGGDRGMGDRSAGRGMGDRGDRGPGDRRGRAPPPAPTERREDSRGKTSSMQIQHPVSKAKDPMKMAGHKSSIKLTLRSDKSSESSSKKRSAPDASSAPAAKKPVVKPPEPAKAPVRITLPKKKELVPTSLSPKKEEKSPTKTGKSSASGGGGSSKKKSMSSRREELLQQLKAVEDAIARKRAKMN